MAKEQSGSGVTKDLERVQEFLNVTFNAMNQGITIYDSSLRLVAWNNLYEEMGITPPQFLYYGAYLIDAYLEFAKNGIFGPGDPQLLAEKRINAIREGPLVKSEILSPPTGRSIQINRIRLPNGGICATFNDVTDELKIEQQLRQSQKMDAVGKLTGGVAHDINNILAIVTGNLELAIDRVADEKVTGLIRSALEASDRGARLTQRLLAFSRQQPLSPEVVQIGKLLKDLLDMLRKLLGETIEVKLISDPELWNCEIDVNQLENVLFNLAVNARDAMPDGGKITIEVSNARITDEFADNIEIDRGQCVCLSVTDNGSGMSAEVAERAFEPFFTTKRDHGTGLGLSMAHGFVKQSGGHIQIHSRLGEGTTIAIYLPWIECETSQPSDKKPRRQNLASDDETVLIVEDDDDLREVLVGQLKSLGYTTLAASNAKTALELINQEDGINILITDVVLPGGTNGRELQEAANQINPNLPVIFVSGYTENTIAQYGRLEKGVILLQKPFRMIDLANTIRKVLDE